MNQSQQSSDSPSSKLEVTQDTSHYNNDKAHRDAMAVLDEREKEKAVEHTPLPWHTNGLYIMPDKSSREIARAQFDGSRGGEALQKANAAFIVEACNNYERIKAQRDELLAACKEASEPKGFGESVHEWLTRSNAVLLGAIARVEGRKP